MIFRMVFLWMVAAAVAKGTRTRAGLHSGAP